MKKTVIILLSFVYSAGFAQSSQFKAKLNRKDEPIYLKIDQASATIEGYDGDDIVIEAVPTITATPPQANGLKQVSITGRDKEDNIIEPRLQEDSRGLQITIPAGNFSQLSIRVPQSSVLAVVAFNYLNNSKISVKNINSINLSGVFSSLDVNNVSDFTVMVSEQHMAMRGTGKFKLSNIQWSNEPVIVNGKPRNRTYKVNSFNSDIDMILPGDIRANIIVLSEYGRTFSNLNFNPLPASSRDIRNFGYSFRREPGQEPPPIKSIAINNGGVDIKIESTYGDIFLKRQ